MNSLVAGTPEYNRSIHASAWVQKVQMLRDIQTERGNVKEKLKKNKDMIMSKVKLVLKSKKVSSLAIYMVAEFLVETKMPISSKYIEKSKKITSRVDEINQVRHIFQNWNISRDPYCFYQYESRPSIDKIHHKLSVVVENRLSDMSSPMPTEPLPLTSKNYACYKRMVIKHQPLTILKTMCRMRYLKVGGNKTVLVERLVAEKW